MYVGNKHRAYYAKAQVYPNRVVRSMSDTVANNTESAATGCRHGKSADTQHPPRHGSTAQPDREKLAQSQPPQWKRMLQAALDEAAQPAAECAPAGGLGCAAGQDALDATRSRLGDTAPPASAQTQPSTAATRDIAPMHKVVVTESRFVHPVSKKEYVAVGHGATEEQARERAWKRITAEMRETEHIARMPEQPRACGGGSS